MKVWRWGLYGNSRTDSEKEMQNNNIPFASPVYPSGSQDPKVISVEATPVRDQNLYSQPVFPTAQQNTYHPQGQYSNIPLQNENQNQLHGFQYQAPVAQSMGTIQQHQATYGPNNGHGMQVQQFYAGKYGFMHGHRQFHIKQKFEALEAAAQAVGCDCIEQENKYEVFDSLNGQPLLYVKEQSDMFCRCCCRPNHPVDLFFYDMAHPAFNHQQKPRTSENPPNPSLVMKVHKPFKFNCPVCCEICMHEEISYAGQEKIGSANKAFPCGGWFSPDIEVKDGAGQTYAKVTGPFCCFGGLVELCSQTTFGIFDAKSGQSIGAITKMKPKGMAHAMAELAGDADQFVMTLPQDMNDQKAANLLATLFLMDYVFFESGAPVQYNPADGSFTFNCFDCYCFGCVWGCQCSSGGRNSNN